MKKLLKAKFTAHGWEEPAEETPMALNEDEFAHNDFENENPFGDDGDLPPW